MNVLLHHHHHPLDSPCLVGLDAITTSSLFLFFLDFSLDHFPLFDFTCILFMFTFVDLFYSLLMHTF